jgi:hypothetical protein
MTTLICEHVYRNVGAAICPTCDKPTHEIDWEFQNAIRREHREKHGILYNPPREWWSI